MLGLMDGRYGLAKPGLKAVLYGLETIYTPYFWEQTGAPLVAFSM